MLALGFTQRNTFVHKENSYICNAIVTKTVSIACKDCFEAGLHVLTGGTYKATMRIPSSNI